jgi:hypothetical protein
MNRVAGHNHGHSSSEDNQTRTHDTQLRFLHAWAKSGERLTLFHRTLFMLLSLALLIISVSILSGLIASIREKGNVGASLAGFIGLGIPMLAIAIFGLRNVLRFPKK